METAALRQRTWQTLLRVQMELTSKMLIEPSRDQGIENRGSIPGFSFVHSKQISEG
jgi:hypothetical protein